MPGMSRCRNASFDDMRRLYMAFRHLQGQLLIMVHALDAASVGSTRLPAAGMCCSELGSKHWTNCQLLALATLHCDRSARRAALMDGSYRLLALHAGR
jgi:hypothetical protein